MQSLCQQHRKPYEILRHISLKKRSRRSRTKKATIFSYTANEEDSEAQGIIRKTQCLLPIISTYGKQAHSRDKLEEYISLITACSVQISPQKIPNLL